ETDRTPLPVIECDAVHAMDGAVYRDDRSGQPFPRAHQQWGFPAECGTFRHRRDVPTTGGAGIPACPAA
ncbi:MAG TPA: hypothetical protein PLV10_03545, partial [Candidatus Latescibacteria bacterium]|nr:hypothetical protein [Candidatus Latescibacterota bacterium]